MDINYDRPICTDTAVCMCFFSPAGFKNPKKNFLNIEKLLNDANIPTFTIECVIGNQEPFIKNPTVQVRSNTPLFYKEHLYNLLVPKIPEQYTKLIFIDADIIFDDPKWIDKISEALNTYDVLQPFQNASWFGEDNKTIIRKLESFVFGVVNNSPNLGINDKYHPGFSFAMTRNFYNQIGGFFDKCIFGSGDSMFCNFLFKNLNFQTRMNTVHIEYLRWLNPIRTLEFKQSYMPFNVYHLYHGTITDRKYVSRYDLLQQFDNIPFNRLFYRNKDGVYETDNVQLKQIMQGYFESRNEDYIAPKIRYSRFKNIKLH